MANKKGVTDFKQTDEVRSLFLRQLLAHKGFIHTFCNGILQNLSEFRYKTTEQTFNRFGPISCTRAGGNPPNPDPEHWGRGRKVSYRCISLLPLYMFYPVVFCWELPKNI
jgi:hypothetical protein